MLRSWMPFILLAVKNLNGMTSSNSSNEHQCTHTDKVEWAVDCVSHSWTKLECCWQSPWDDDTYTVELDNRLWSSLCSSPEDRCCHWGIPDYLTVVQDQMVKFTHQQGCGTYKYNLDSYAVVIPGPPRDVGVELINGTLISMTWRLPAEMETFPPGVIANVQAKNHGCVDCLWIELTSRHVLPKRTPQKSPVTWELELPYPGVTYSLRMFLTSATAPKRNDNEDGYGSDGGGNNMIYTTQHHGRMYSQQTMIVTSDPDIPQVRVSLRKDGFQVVYKDGGMSDLTVSWPPLPWHTHNGPHFRYLATLWEKDKWLVLSEVSTPYVTFYNVSSEAECRVEVVCSNAVGSSAVSSELVVRSDRPLPPVVHHLVRYNETVYQMRVFSVDEDISHYSVFRCTDDVISSSPCLRIDYIQTFAITDLLNLSTNDFNGSSIEDNLRLGVSAESSTGVSSGIVWPDCITPRNASHQALLPTVTINCHTRHDSCQIQWSESCDKEVLGVLKELNIIWCPGRLNSTGDCKELRQSLHVGDSANRILELQDLSPQTGYTVSIIFTFYSGIVKDTIIHFETQNEVIGVGLVTTWTSLFTVSLVVTLAATIISRRKITVFFKDMNTMPKIPNGLSLSVKDANKPSPHKDEKKNRSSLIEHGSLLKINSKLFENEIPNKISHIEETDSLLSL